jgi:peptide/histidine transporter 3/4
LWVTLHFGNLFSSSQTFAWCVCLHIHEFSKQWSISSILKVSELGGDSNFECRFLDKASTPRNWKEEDQQPDYSTKVSPDIERRSSSSTLSNVSTSKSSPWRLCTVTQVEEVKLLVRVMPIWVFTLMFLVAVSQSSSFFLSTGTTMDLSMGPHFKISAASMEIVTNITALLMILVYQLCFVPLARRFTGNERGISMLQRIGVGLVISIIAMIVAAVVESKRLQLIKIHGLQNNRTVPVPMSVFWLTPQYSILGLAQVFSYLGLLEFFYDQAPDGMHSIGTALFASNTGVAHFLCTAIVDIVTSASGSQSGSGNHQSWIVNDINKCRVDKYYWTLAALSAINFCIYLVVAHWYTYKKVQVHEDDAESRKVVLQLTNEPNQLVKA